MNENNNDLKVCTIAQIITIIIALALVILFFINKNQIKETILLFDSYDAYIEEVENVTQGKEDLAAINTTLSQKAVALKLAYIDVKIRSKNLEASNLTLSEENAIPGKTEAQINDLEARNQLNIGEADAINGELNRIQEESTLLEEDKEETLTIGNKNESRNQDLHAYKGSLGKKNQNEIILLLLAILTIGIILGFLILLFLNKGEVFLVGQRWLLFGLVSLLTLNPLYLVGGYLNHKKENQLMKKL